MTRAPLSIRDAVGTASVEWNVRDLGMRKIALDQVRGVVDETPITCCGAAS
jgi:hypothetical protein